MDAQPSKGGGAGIQEIQDHGVQEVLQSDSMDDEHDSDSAPVCVKSKRSPMAMALEDEDLEEPKLRKCEDISGDDHFETDEHKYTLFPCQAPGCLEHFETIKKYEEHYHTKHWHVCGECKKIYPTEFLLGLHVQESHDMFFKVKSEKQPMFECYLQVCVKKFNTPDERFKHCVDDHKFPPTFLHSTSKRDFYPKPKQAKKKKNPKPNTNKTAEAPTRECEMTSLENPPDGGEAMDISRTPKETQPKCSTSGVEKKSKPKRQTEATQAPVKSKHATKKPGIHIQFGHSSAARFVPRYQFGMAKPKDTSEKQGGIVEGTKIDLAEVKSALEKVENVNKPEDVLEENMQEDRSRFLSVSFEQEGTPVQINFSSRYERIEHGLLINFFKKHHLNCTDIDQMKALPASFIEMMSLVGEYTDSEDDVNDETEARFIRPDSSTKELSSSKTCHQHDLQKPGTEISHPHRTQLGDKQADAKEKSQTNQDSIIDDEDEYFEQHHQSGSCHRSLILPESDSSDESDDSGSNNLNVSGKLQNEIKNRSNEVQLQNPFRSFGASIAEVSKSDSVFQIEFLEDEQQKSNALQKHVKMTSVPGGTARINGKKVCFNFRKGKCRFGHNCKYGHDSDLLATKQASGAASTGADGKVKEFTIHKAAAPVKPEYIEYDPSAVITSEKVTKKEKKMSSDDEDATERSDHHNLKGKKKRKRPGLSQNLTPGKKVMNAYFKSKDT